MAKTTRVQRIIVDKLDVPLGRAITDVVCSYTNVDVVVIRLQTADGLTGWGFRHLVTSGTLDRSAPWVVSMPAAAELNHLLDERVAPALSEWSIDDGDVAVPSCGLDYVDEAVRIAVWDLRARSAGQPLWQFLGGEARTIPAYGSLLDFRLDEPETVALAERFLALGLSVLKVKVGAAEPGRDIERLLGLQRALPVGTRFTADANQSWSWEQAVRNLTAFEAAGIILEYIEDPLPVSDVEGAARLAENGPVPVIGHDYLTDVDQYRPYLERGVFSALRAGSTIDRQLAVAALAEEHELPLIFGNTTFETGIHVAITSAATDRIEFSGAAWNDLVIDPVRVENGHAIAPSGSGLGIEIHDDALAQFAQPGPSLLPPLT